MESERCSPVPVPDAIVRLCREFRRRGHLLVVVGGGVRDHLLGRPRSGTWDLATSAPLRVILKVCPGARTDDDSHTDLTLVLATCDGTDVELTPFRFQHDFARFGRPDWSETPATLEQDLLGRDFTMNAMAYDPLEQVIHDPCGGRRDLELGLVRALPDPDARFRYDPVRILRGIRLAAGLDLTIDDSTFESMSSIAKAIEFEPSPRLQREMEKMLSTRPSWCLERLREAGVLAVLLPEMLSCLDVEDPCVPGRKFWVTVVGALEFVADKPSDLRWAILAAGLAEARRLREGTWEPAGAGNSPSVKQVAAEVAELCRRLDPDLETPGLAALAVEAYAWPQDVDSWDRAKEVARSLGHIEVARWEVLARAWQRARLASP